MGIFFIIVVATCRGCESIVLEMGFLVKDDNPIELVSKFALL